ncbi:MAG: hypothetical protein ACREBU_01535 [Nitrososphaera sp.]
MLGWKLQRICDRYSSEELLDLLEIDTKALIAVLNDSEYVDGLYELLEELADE